MTETSTQTQLKLGAHVSTAGGIDKAFERAAAIGANCMQIFSGSPRFWARADVSKYNTAELVAAQKKYNVSPIFTHCLYLINLASEKPELVVKSCDAIKYDLTFDAQISGGGVVVHLGSSQGRGWEPVREQVAECLRDIMANTPQNSRLLIENAASQKGKIGGSLAEIRWLLDEVGSPRLQWCFDTCHGFAAGHNLGAPNANDEKLGAIEEIDRYHLWEDLACIHVNDSRDPLASERDRHANLGEGQIPSADLKFFLNSPLVRSKPLILEVPGIDGEGPDSENMHRLQALTQV